ncbi:MAG: NAD-dependent epimerase/dehydratase family protein [Polaromonas sp.]|uniref:NAD-dependent epimerase/dehydratase family protein n=1 Tax=Polaromonas sp. TaxID=1869339 RepID=UPI002486CE3B|nr:NAD-dependent epimerase/dehydratase family protein [Polaromonas sp.]MDI1270366.1 NAD-dependent epimerase/dehydratase family protein [Polaromonas sp.]
METVAITGASGYIGRHLVAQLRRLGNVRIKVLSRRNQRTPGSAQFGSGVEVVEGNLFMPDSLKGFLEPGCTVVHLAYLQGGGESENLAATANLLEACKDANIRRLIHCSTAAVVGRVPDNIITEETPCNPVSEYGVTKLKIEKAVVDAAVGSFDVAILRPTSVFGPEGGSLKKLIGNLMARKTIRNYLKSCLFNRRRMNLVHVGNVVAAVIFMVEYKENFGGGIFIISEDDNSRNNFADVEQFLMRQLGLTDYRIPTISIPLHLLSLFLKLLGRNNVNPLCNYDPRKLLDMGFTRPVEFEVGLRHYSDWYRSNSL